jgi:hypothetical protein
MSSRNCLIIFSFLFFVPPSVSSQNRLIWDGEVATDTCQNEWGKKTDSIAHSGTYCFMGFPDPWHGPGVKLGCTPSWRVNLSIYNELHFWVKANTDVPRALNIGIYGWPNASRSIDITPYLVGGGTINSTWKEARVPIDSLKTATFKLGVAEIIYFGGPTPPNGYRFFIDDIWAHDTKPTTVTGIKILSDKVLRINVADRYDTTTVQNLNNYYITSPDDADFATPQYPAQVSMHYYVEDYDSNDNYNNPIPLINYQLFTTFNNRFKNGKTYTINVSSIKDMAGNEFTAPYSNTFTFNDLQEITGSVKANHVGYLPTRPKYGYIGNFLGAVANDIVVLPISQAPTFEIRDANTHQTVFSGTATLRQSLSSYNCNGTFSIADPTIDRRWAGEKVYSCDFSSFTQTGTYYLYAAGYGRSYTFKIAANVYDETYRTVIRSLYMNRCGIELAPQYAGQWSRPICHAADGVIHSSQAASPLYGGEVVGSTQACSHGWHDAGDYGKYVASAAQPVNDLLVAYEMYPQKFPDGFNNIPESGNGIPDVLDEVKWELDWLLNMQAPDGGVYFKVVTTNWPNWMPQNDNATRWITEKTTHATGMACAMYAAAARVYRPFLPVFADTCLARARRAWAWLEAHPETYPTIGFKNPTGIGGGEYGDPGETSDVDERAWAAAELYKTTGEAAMQDRFLYFWTKNDPTYGWNQFQHNQLRATWAYCTTRFPTSDLTRINSYKNSVKVGIEQYHIPRLNQTTYRCSHRPEVMLYINWGSFGISTRYAWEEIKASYLLGKDYYNTASVNLDVQLGNNPQNRSYITGVGYDYPMDPLHHPSNTDGIVEPLPGLCVFGPHSTLGGAGYAGVSQSKSNLYPFGNWECAPYPMLRRYYDVFENIAMSEPVRSEEATTAAVLAYFSSQNANIVISLELLDFQGIAEKTGNRLTWAFVDTKDFLNLEVQKSKDGADFTPLSIFTKNEVSTTDATPFATTYYRLKTTERDGTTSFSKTIAVNRLNTEGGKKKIKIYPNPATDVLTIENTEGKDIEIVNVLGQVVLSEKNIRHSSFTIHHLEKGVYFVKTGGEVVRFVKD